MFDFCPHCGQAPEQEQAEGQTVVCRHCGQEIGVVPRARQPVILDQTEELIQQGTAARCPICQQVVEVKVRGMVRSLVPHAAKGEPRKLCPGGGKALPAPMMPDRLRAAMHKDVIAVVRCGRSGTPTIEELTLEYLDKADRVRLQIDALRELLGPAFRMQDYPLDQPELAIWSNAQTCVIARKHPRGGYQALGGEEIARVLADLRRERGRFFAPTC